MGFGARGHHEVSIQSMGDDPHNRDSAASRPDQLAVSHKEGQEGRPHHRGHFKVLCCPKRGSEYWAPPETNMRKLTSRMRETGSLPSHSFSIRSWILSRTMSQCRRSSMCPVRGTRAVPPSGFAEVTLAVGSQSLCSVQRRLGTSLHYYLTSRADTHRAVPKVLGRGTRQVGLTSWFHHRILFGSHLRAFAFEHPVFVYGYNRARRASIFSQSSRAKRDSFIWLLKPFSQCVKNRSRYFDVRSIVRNEKKTGVLTNETSLPPSIRRACPTAISRKWL